MFNLTMKTITIFAISMLVALFAFGQNQSVKDVGEPDKKNQTF